MPHQCTSCGRVFQDGSKEMLSGCPDCGGNKFQFRPPGASSFDDPDSSSDLDGPGPSGSETVDGIDRAEELEGGEGPIGEGPVGEGPVGEGPGTPDGIEERTEKTADTDDEIRDDATVIKSENEPEEGPVPEDRAQADARSSVVSEDELSFANDVDTTASNSPETGGDGASSSEGTPPREDPDAETVPPERPDLSQLREELNSQFESIKIVSQGRYELNLMELYDRQEYIISLQEDGRYVIEMPDAWGPDDE